MGLKQWMIRLAPGLALLTALAAFTPALSAQAASDSVAVSEIEQIYVNMPEIRTYFSHLDEDVREASEIKAFYDDAALSCQSTAVFSETGDGVDYYVLLDTSTSIREEVFPGMKDAVLSVGKALGEKDRMTLITIGGEEKEVYRSDRSGDDLETIVGKIRATDGSTSLFGGLSLAAALSDSNNSDNYRRKICILYADGYDNAAGKQTFDETRDTLTKYQLPVYTVSAVATTSEDNQKLGELSRTTGGAMKVPGSGSSFTDMTNEILDSIRNSQVLVFRADNNLVSPNEKKSFSVKFTKKDITKSRDVYFIRSQKDDTAPKIEKVEADGANRLKFYFSEDVLDADNPKNYQITNDQGSDLIVTEAVYEKKDGKYIGTISFSEEIVKGDYHISCRNICDNSMQKNAIVGSIDQYLEGVDPPNAFLQFILSWQGIILAVVVAAAAVVVVIVIIRGRKKSAKAARQAAEQAAQQAASQAQQAAQQAAAQAAQQAAAQAAQQAAAQAAQQAASRAQQAAQQAAAQAAQQAAAQAAQQAAAQAAQQAKVQQPMMQNPSQPRQQVVNDIEKQTPKYVVNIREPNSIFMNIQLESGESKMAEIEFDDRLVVGRSPSCDVCIDDRFIARNQFVIEKQNGQYYVTDLNSTNGTSVNGIRITGKRRLEQGDVISAGMVRMTVSWK